MRNIAVRESLQTEGLLSGDRSEVARIDPIPDDGSRPFWSVMIPTYNCANYLRETLASVLVQDLGPHAMQIEVVDDCSDRDDPQAVVQELGPGRVGFYRQVSNLGHTGNFLTCLRRARGHVVHMLHGDDYVRPGFYAKMEQALNNSPTLGAAFCRNIYADDNGHWLSISALERQEAGVWLNAARKLARTQLIQTPSIVVRRAVYEELGGFNPKLLCAEDWEMWVRIAVRYPIWFEPEPLAVYRKHAGSNTSRYTVTGENVRYLQRCVNTFKHYFSSEEQSKLVATARGEIAHDAIATARTLFDQGERRPALVHLWEALKCSRKPVVVRGVMRVLVAQLRKNFGRSLRNRRFFT